MSRYNYFAVVSVDGYNFPDAPQAVFGFNSQGFSFVNRGSSVVEYSFDGSTVHGDLNPGDVSKNPVFESRTECKVWFRTTSTTTLVRVEAWGGWGH